MINPMIPLSVDTAPQFGSRFQAAIDRKREQRRIEAQERRQAELQEQSNDRANDANNRAEQTHQTELQGRRRASAVTGALEVANLPRDEQRIRLKQRIADLQRAGIDSSNSERALQLHETGNFEQFDHLTDQAIQMGYQTGLLKQQGDLVQGVGRDGDNAFFRIGPDGVATQVEGATPTPDTPTATEFDKKLQLIGNMPDGPERESALRNLIGADKPEGPIKMGDDILLDPNSFEIVWQGTPSSGLDTEGLAKLEQSVRKEYLAQSKDFGKVADAFDRISVSQPDAVGDLSLIFQYMKMLDPGSTVREGEFATAQSARGVPESVLGQYNRIASGERLTDAQRSSFLQQAELLYLKAGESQAARERRYRGVARANSLRPDQVVGDSLVRDTSIGDGDGSGDAVKKRLQDKYPNLKWTE